MSSDEVKVKQLTARCDKAVALLGQIHDEIRAIKHALEGVNPVGEVMQYFDSQWMHRYTHGSNPPVHYEWNRTVDPAHIKRILKVMDATTLKGRIARYFSDRDPFLAKNKHPFNLFISRLNTYATTSDAGAARGLADDGGPVVGCTHTPRCTSDAEHTRKRMGEMRR